jgi:hypothetical protein
VPTYEKLRTLFPGGYSSGDILARVPGPRRLIEEVRIGASYRQVFHKAILPHLQPDSRVLELGPGKGSWTKAILKHVPNGEVHVADFHDVRRWIKRKPGDGALVCHRVSDNSFAGIPDNYFDFFWSFGVLCHNNIESIREILHSSLPKLKHGGIATHEIGDWQKLDALGWAWRYGVPQRFKNLPDDAIWWPRNDAETMCRVAQEEGWQIVSPDLGLLQRDSLCVLRRP